jgi:hypothetical protein
MKCEPLRNKKQEMKKDILVSKDYSKTERNEFYLGFEKGIDDSFDVFASFFDLYKRYKNDLKLLMNEQKPVWLEWVKYYETQTDINKSNYFSRYNDWLFHYIFYDVNGTKSDDFLSL